jgi:hypothetical protein
MVLGLSVISLGGEGESKDLVLCIMGVSVVLFRTESWLV